jgi:2-haloacid dehalogenase
METAGQLKTPFVLFDVNETLLDMEPLKKKVNKLLNSEYGFRIWFGMLLHYSLVDNCTDRYHDFSEIGRATLEMAAHALEADIKAEDIKEAMATMRELKAYPDVNEGLELLKDAGFRLATLTNSPPESLTKQLEYAGIKNYFEATLSVDSIRKYKPSGESYHYAAETLGTKPGDITMVAAHGWDIAGAMGAGLMAAFVERKGQALYPLSPKPLITGATVLEVAKQIIHRLR